MELSSSLAGSRRRAASTELTPADATIPKIKLCCELQLKSADFSFHAVSDAATSWLSSAGLTIALGMHNPQRVGVPLLAQACSSICIEPVIPGGDFSKQQLPEERPEKKLCSLLIGSCSSSTENNPEVFPYCQAHITVLPYTLHNRRTDAGIVDMGEEGNVSIFQQWTIPNREFDGLWRNLHFDDAIKATLLEYTSTALIFSDKNVDAKASERDVNEGRESGKRIIQAFQEIRGLLEDKDCLVVILIDEVESLSASRCSAASREPSDSVRAVNALLTQIDTLSPFPNALVLTTSNLTGDVIYHLSFLIIVLNWLHLRVETCDPAFIDRADLKLFIPSPNAKCRYDILSGCIQELVSSKACLSADQASCRPQSRYASGSSRPAKHCDALILW
ncbi:hypothetical protein Efla_007041 [Eimeria flavescens]